MNTNRHHWLALPLLVCGSLAIAEDSSELTSKTVIGPSNPDLTYGAEALLAGDIEKGVRLTEAGLKVASNRRERKAGLQNLCAGYVLLEQYEKALEMCNTAIAEYEDSWRAYNNRALLFVRLERYAEAEADLAKGQEIAPNARTLKEVRGILLDATSPVKPNIVIDDRRSPGESNSLSDSNQGDNEKRPL